MKTHAAILFTVLAMLVISAYGFSGDLAGNIKALEELGAVTMKYEEACQKKDPAALGELFTKDAVCVTPKGLLVGRQEIEKASADEFQQWLEITQFCQADELNAIGTGAWSVGRWWRTLQSQEGPIFVRGYWSALFVPEADGWKLRMLIFNESLPRIRPASLP